MDKLKPLIDTSHIRFKLSIRVAKTQAVQGANRQVLYDAKVT